MMDFDNILDIASQNQGLGNVQHKRYSLQAGPPKKDPKSRGVNPAAVQALLKQKIHDSKKKEIQLKKQKEELMAKRVELKSDRKARAMASRTKDNFRGYNGVPVVEVPKKRRSKLEMQEEASLSGERFRNHSIDPEDDEDNYEYEQTDSEPEETPEPQRPSKSTGGGGSSGKPCSKKNTGPPKAAKPTMNFADLLKLAEKKQFEPVELKAKPVKKETRLRTADEIRELEMERKAKKQVKDRDSNTERERDAKPQSSSSSMRKGTGEREQKNCKPQKNHLERPGLPTGSEKRSHQTPVSNRSHSSSKPTAGDRERERPKTSQSDRDRYRTGVSGSSGGVNSKLVGKVIAVPSSSHKSTSSDLSFKKEASSLHPGRASGVPGTRPPGTAAQKPQHGGSQQTRPGQGSSSKQGPPDRGLKSGKPGVNSAVKSSGNSVMRTSSGGPPKAGGQLQVRPGVNAAERSSGNSVMRTSSGGPPKTGGRPQARPGDAVKAKAGGVPQGRPAGRGIQGHSGGSGARPPGNRPGSGGLVPGPGPGTGPGRPKCTVVSETISSKNFGGPRMGMPPRPGMAPGMAPRPGMPPRPMMNRPPGTALPPITSAYKRKYEDEEDYDSEMEDFIDNGGEEQDEISKHIKAIFGYDRTRYRDESDYALKFMESSWKDMQKEEARSLKLAVQEDLEEEKREEEELQRSMKRRKNN